MLYCYICYCVDGRGFVNVLRSAQENTIVGFALRLSHLCLHFTLVVCFVEF